MKYLLIIFVSIMIFVACSPSDKYEKEAITKKELATGKGEIKDLVVISRKSDIGDIQIVYYKAKTSRDEVFTDSIMLSITSDGIYSEVPW